MPDPGPTQGMTARARWRRVAFSLFVVLVAAPLAAVTVIGTRGFAPAPGFLEIDMRAAGGSTAQMFWTATWAFSETQSALVGLTANPDDVERVRFPLPTHPLEFVRFDPIDGAGEVVIRQMRVTDAAGRTIRTIDPLVMSPLHQIAAVTKVEEGVKIATTAGANDPMMLLRTQWLLPAPGRFSWQFVVPVTLAWIVGAVLTLITAGVLIIGSEVGAGPFAARHALWFAALFVTVVAAKLTLLQHYPMPVPYWDQWDAEAAGLYLPWASGGLTWRQMFTLHNEHRIFFTRVFSMALLWLDGQWDPQLQIVVNIALHAITVTIVAAILWLAAGRRWLAWIAAALALTVVPPFALENTLSGFQSAFYFLVLFSVLAIWLMGTRRPGSIGWSVGWLCAFATIFTVAGGVLTVAAIAIIVSLRTLAPPRKWGEGAVNVAALAGVAVVAWLAMSPPLPQHDFLLAGTVQAFKVAFARNLAFPWVMRPRASVIVWIPFIALAATVLVRRFRSGRFEQTVLAVGGWALLQAAAVAYSRGANGAVPASRYLDMLSFGFVVNTMALLFLVNGWRRFRWSAAVGWSAVVLWLVVSGVGMAAIGEQTLQREGAERRQFMRTYVRNIRQLTVAGNTEALLRKAGPLEIPYYDPAMLTAWLREPYLSAILPSSLRHPLMLTAKAGTTPTFDRPASPVDPTPVWDSYARSGNAATGRFESEPVRCTAFDRLRFEIAGSPDRDGLRLALRDVASGHETAVRGSVGAGRAWRSVSVRCPDGPFSVVAEDASPTASFGFRAPTEIAWASALAESLIEQWAAFNAAAAALTLLALGFTAHAQLARTASSSASEVTHA